MPSHVTPAQVQALVDTDLTTEQLQEVIDREEADLAAAIGPLAGERTELVYPASWPDTTASPVILRRRTDGVAVVDKGIAVAGADLRLIDGYQLERATGRWSGPVEVTYTPNDLLRVARIVIELVRLTLTETGYLSETIGEYSYSRGARGGKANPTEAARKGLLAQLRPPRAPSTVRLITARVVSEPETAWLGNA